jgi:hypothetical protein
VGGPSCLQRMTAVTEVEETSRGRPRAHVTAGRRRGEAAPGTSTLADRNILHLFQVCLKGQGKESLLMHPWLPLSFLISTCLCFYSICFRGGGQIHLCHRRSRLGRGSWRMSWCMRLFGKVPRVSSVRSPSLRVNLRRCARVGRWPWRNSAACLTRWLMARGG